nr:unnamed protein product [Callosobruchus analis]
MVTEVNGKEDLEAKLKEAGDKLVVLEFYAKWCGACKKISPQYKELVNVYPNVMMLQVRQNQINYSVLIK